MCIFLLNTNKFIYNKLIHKWLIIIKLIKGIIIHTYNKIQVLPIYQ